MCCGTINRRVPRCLHSDFVAGPTQRCATTSERMWGRRRKVHYELTGVIKGFTASRGDANRDSKVCCVLERLLKRNLELIRALALRRAPTYADHDRFGFRVNGRVHSLEKTLIGVPSEVDSLHGAWTDGTRDL